MVIQLFQSLIDNGYFVQVAHCELHPKKAGCWVFKNKRKYWGYESNADVYNWVYFFRVLKNGIVVEIPKIGGTGAKGGMKSRESSYQSGNPKYDEKNGPANRRIYLEILDYLQQGYEIELFAHRCLPEKTEVTAPWRVDKIEGYVQTYKIYEEDLIKLYEETHGSKPEWNRYAS